MYEADAATDAKSSVADIINTGRDVTDRFDITVNGTKVTAKAHADYLAEQVGLKNPKWILERPTRAERRAMKRAAAPTFDSRL